MTGFNLLEKIRKREEDCDKEVSLILEKMRSSNLSFFDEAIAIHNLIKNYGLTQEEAAEKLGRVQSTIANKLRLLRLTEEERKLIVEYSLTERHARSLLRIASYEDRKVILDKIIELSLNVERTDQLVDIFIGNQNRLNRYKKSQNIHKNISDFNNTIIMAVEKMKSTGISAELSETENNNYIEYNIKLCLEI